MRACSSVTSSEKASWILPCLEKNEEQQLVMTKSPIKHYKGAINSRKASLDFLSCLFGGYSLNTCRAKAWAMTEGRVRPGLC